MASERLRGWDEITTYVGVHRRTAERYEKSRGLPIHRLPGGGPKSPVFAFSAELDEWIETNVPGSRRKAIHDRERTVNSHADIAEPILSRIRAVSNLTLYRRDYRLRFVLRKSLEGVRCNLECRYEVCNATDERQPFEQEITLDVPDHGYVEEMALLVDGKAVYVLQRPKATEKLLSYSSYRGRKVLVEPSSRGVKYECRVSWVINRAEDDIWSTHMLLPTLGVTVEIDAAADFNTTPSFSTSELVMKAEHVDIAWSRRYTTLLAP